VENEAYLYIPDSDVWRYGEKTEKEKPNLILGSTERNKRI
jgi:hypothetical protein